MKPQENRQLDHAKRRAPRKVLWGAAAGVSLGLVLASVAIFSARSESPRQRVAGPVARGEKIEPAKPAGSNAISISLVPFTQSSTDAVNSLSDSRQSPSTATNGPAAAPPSLDRATNLVVFDRKKYLPISFAQLSSFQLKLPKPVRDAGPPPELVAVSISDQVPVSIKWLNEKQVAVTGFMLPVRVEAGLTTDFLLLKNQNACCYGIKPNPNEWVVVHTAGKGVKPTMDVPVTVTGIFHIGELREEGHFIGIYLLTCDGLLIAKRNP